MHDDPNLPEQAVHDLDGMPNELTRNDLVRARQLLRETLDDFDRGPELVRTRLLRAVELLEGGGDRPHQRVQPPLLPPAIRERVLKHILDNLEQTLKLSDLADFAGASPGYFCRAFKATFGLPTHAFITRLRLERAVRLIRRTNMPLCEIALACGFCDQSHMCNLFRRIFGDTPSRCRRGLFIPSLPSVLAFPGVPDARPAPMIPTRTQDIAA
jgi:AraC family transcriptional regulator